MDHKTIEFGGLPLHQRLLSDLPQITRLVLDRLVEDLPVYRSMPAELLTGDVQRIVETILRAFVAVLRTGELPTQDQLDTVRRSAARRAEEGIPIDAVTGAYFLGFQATFEHLTPLARPEELEDILVAHRLMISYLRLATGAVAAGYVGERQAVSGEEHAAKQTLLTALLEGQPIEQAARQAGIEPPATYLVLSLTVGAHPDESRPGVDPLVVGRRKLRRLRGELDQRTHGLSLSTLSVDGGLALVPAAEPDWPWLRSVVADLAKAAVAPVTAAVVPAAPADVPAAARLAGELRDVITAYGKPPGLYRLGDLLVEYQLTRPSPARDQLATLLEPAAAKPDLLDTLRVYLSTGLNRRRAATELRVHPNTVDYRLRKIATLTGLDVGRDQDLLTVRAALSAHDSAR
ncbi:PucR family transcriptional regulator [Actinokineospora sp. HUAS TT18]|uniref:PucR family transcriptional regulator n=1 Tax=Actinokineospora sp. HUAS TT18 TaxID=3447451 RepID=UPI003F527BD9